MNSRQRVLSALARQGYDRIPVKHEGTPEINQMLMEHFGLSSNEQLLRLVGDDFRYVGPVYRGPELRTFPDGSFEGLWGERYNYLAFKGGTYPEAVYLPFAGVHDPDKLDRSHFPTADWFDASTIESQCEALEGRYAICCGGAGEMDFINGISRARGMQEVLIDLITDDPVYLEIMQARFQFTYDLHERCLQAAGGMIDLTHIGEDLGNQRGQMIGMDTFERHFAPKYGKYFQMAHRYGAKVMMHMCGCVDVFLPRLIEMGLDIYDVVQPTTPEMDIAQLQRKYGEKLNFCGSVCVQSTLPYGTVRDVEREVKRRLELFAQGGLFLGPTHAIQVNTPLENILALYRTAGSLDENAAASGPTIQVENPRGKIDMRKLF